MEICVDNIESAVNAAAGGASRLELCSALPEGGLTPSVGMLRTIKAKVHIPIFCMLRCRPGNFCFTPDEISNMQIDAKLLLENGADGIVFGALTEGGSVDQNACRQIFEVVPENVEMTFHRAFDWTHDPTQALMDVCKMGRFSRILTSGHASNAPEGAGLLKQLVNEVRQAGYKITIMPGCGINYRNIIELVDKTGCLEFHASAAQPRKFSGHRNHRCSMGTQDSEMKFCRKEIVSAMAHYLKFKKMDFENLLEDESRRERRKWYFEEYFANKSSLDLEFGHISQTREEIQGRIDSQSALDDATQARHDRVMAADNGKPEEQAFEKS